ncbi:Wadjet anti-phage system protein JetD domain-containing protein [Methylobacillus sp. Pita2]|uniref:Wadjet anti-phage system protein JetD domain-containing protein n=1 Tax=Methylobacillus sp. Pita2 TaxID=3383245 RepID=UPI0038B42A57
MTFGIPIEAVKSAIIKKMDGKIFLMPKGLIGSLAKESGEDPLAVKQALARLSKDGWIDGVSFDGTPFGQVKILGVVPTKQVNPLEELWLDALRSESLSNDEIKSLSACWTSLDGFCQSDLRAIASGLKRLKQDQSSLAGTPAYIISARYFLGSSKLLGEISDRVLSAFGIASDRFPGHPPYVVVGGCATPETVVLVENPASFELAMSTEAAKRCAFIATYGFGLSKANNEYGNQLAGLVESHFSGAITLVREGSSCPPVRDLFRSANITFWGDLDTAGIQIYLRLKQRLPKLELSALYRPMIDMLDNPLFSHPYVTATGKRGQCDMKASCSSNEEVAVELLRRCRTRGVDQECLLPNDISRLAADRLQIPRAPTEA